MRTSGFDPMALVLTILRAMEDCGDNHRIRFFPQFVHDDVRRARDHTLICAVCASFVTEPWENLESFDCLKNLCHGSGCRLRTFLRDPRDMFLEVAWIAKESPQAAAATVAKIFQRQLAVHGSISTWRVWPSCGAMADAAMARGITSHESAGCSHRGLSQHHHKPRLNGRSFETPVAPSPSSFQLPPCQRRLRLLPLSWVSVPITLQRHCGSYQPTQLCQVTPGSTASPPALRLRHAQRLCPRPMRHGFIFDINSVHCVPALGCHGHAVNDRRFVRCNSSVFSSQAWHRSTVSLHPLSCHVATAQPGGRHRTA